MRSDRGRPGRNVQRQRAFIAQLNQALVHCGVRFVTAPGTDGYLVAKLVSAYGGGLQSPKNLIFAPTRKPDLRLGNAMDSDVEVVIGGEDVLIYDRSISPSALLWRDLQSWFETSRGSLRQGRSVSTPVWLSALTGVASSTASPKHPKTQLHTHSHPFNAIQPNRPEKERVEFLEVDIGSERGEQAFELFTLPSTQ